MNKVILIGRLTRDVELTTTTNGINVARFTMAVNRKFRNADGDYETDFINCVAWRNTADLISKHTKKGDRICVCGSVQTRSFDAQDGIKRYVTEIVVDEVEFLEKKEIVNNENLEPVTDEEFPF